MRKGRSGETSALYSSLTGGRWGSGSAPNGQDERNWPQVVPGKVQIGHWGKKGVIEHWQRLPRAVEKSSFLEVIKGMQVWH